MGQVDGTLSGSAPAHIRVLLNPAGGRPFLDADTVAIADGFLELNDKRELADYDHKAVFSRPDTRGHIALARQVVTTVEQSQSAEVARFFGLIALQSRIQAR